MKIGIIGSGFIGEVLTRHLAKKGHAVRVANSRGAASLAALAAETGAVAASVQEAVKNADLVIVSIPQGKITALPKDLFAGVPAHVPVVETGNYYPGRDGRIADIDNGTVESVWVAGHLGRPVIKGFNNISHFALRDGARPKGDKDRIAIPIAGDDAAAKAVVAKVIDEIGFDAVDAGSLAESWRQQPGSPVYATDLDAKAMPGALAAAQREDLPRRFDAMIQRIQAEGMNSWAQLQNMARELFKA